MLARSWNSVRVSPGHTAVAPTPVPDSSFGFDRWMFGTLER